MRLLSVDPGKDYCGLALFTDKTLTLAWLAPTDEAHAQVFCLMDTIRFPHRLVVECPMVYPTWKQKGKQEDIINLALTAGELVGRLGVQTTYLRPYEWKGQVPKKDERGRDTNIIPDRVRAALSADELARVELPRAVKTLGHNVWDAIGIGLVYLGRCRKGVV